MKTALITHAGVDHVTPAGHPEQVARLEHVLHALAPLDLNRIAPLAADDDLLRIHPKSYIDEIKQCDRIWDVSGGCRCICHLGLLTRRIVRRGELRAVDMVLRVRQRIHSWQRPEHRRNGNGNGLCYSETWRWAQNMPWIIMA